MYRYMQSGGEAKSLITMLSENYHGYAQMVYLLQKWLVDTGNIDWKF